MRASQPTPLGVIARGLAAGVAGTAAMDGYQRLVSAVRDSGSGSSNRTEGPKDWSEAPAPAQVGRRIVKGVFKRDVSADHIDLVTNVTHWTYGVSWGGLYGILQASLRANPVRHGLAFGTRVWGTAYVILPAMKLYKPIWEDAPKILALDLSYHLSYGLGVAGAYRALEELGGRNKGRPVAFKRPELEQDVIRCPGCGALLDGDEEACPKCGARLEWSGEGDERRPRLVSGEPD